MNMKQRPCSMEIFCTFLTVNISQLNLISNMNCRTLHLENFKRDFLSFDFWNPQIQEIQVVVSQPNIVLHQQRIYQWKA